MLMLHNWMIHYGSRDRKNFVGDAGVVLKNITHKINFYWLEDHCIIWNLDFLFNKAVF
jgi:hypothetical protein